MLIASRQYLGRKQVQIEGMTWKKQSLTWVPPVCFLLFFFWLELAFMWIFQPGFFSSSFVTKDVSQHCHPFQMSLLAMWCILSSPCFFQALKSLLTENKVKDIDWFLIRRRMPTLALTSSRHLLWSAAEIYSYQTHKEKQEMYSKTKLYSQIDPSLWPMAYSLA